MTWVKGQSGNASGKPKQNAEIVELARRACPQAMATIIDLANNSTDVKIKLAAAKEILDRGYGKAVQAMELSGTDGAPLAVSISFNLKSHKTPSDDDKS